MRSAAGGVALGRYAAKTLMMIWLVVFAGAGCEQRSADSRDAALSTAKSEVEQGRAIYNYRCYYCHGYSGDAKTLAATLVDPPPRNFAAFSPQDIPRERMITAVRDGIPQTAMAAFGQALSARDIERVVDFVRDEFMQRKALNTRYHTAANGWPDHQRYESAFPFATGALALDSGWEQLTPRQQAGKRLYLSSCISCHDRARVDEPGPRWALRAVSFPPGNYDKHDDTGGHGEVAAGPTRTDDPFELHETPPQLVDATPRQRQGEVLYQANCAYCHAADGTGRNWIGSFLEPNPPDFTRREVMQAMPRERLLAATRDGIVGRSMPAWKNVLSAEEIDAIVDYIERAWSVAPSADSARALAPN